MKKLILIAGFSFSFLLININSVSALSCVNISNNLIKGKENSEVLMLQNFLFEKGFLTTKPNGYFGEGTFSAVKKYQDSVSLPDSGLVFNLTRQSIKNETCSTNATTSSNTVAQNQSQVSTQKQSQTTPPSTTSTNNNTCIDLQKNLSLGLENGDVLSVQKFLMKKGFLTVTPNGYFGPSTLKAIKDYQSVNSLNSSGEILALTRANIKKDSCLTSSQSSVNNNTQTAVTVVKQTTTSNDTNKVVTTTAVKVLTPNGKRLEDIANLLGNMYSYYFYSGQAFLISTSTPTEICSLGITMCDNMIEIKSSLVPGYLSKIPHDPTVTDNATGTGYFISRSSNDDITITAPKADSGEIVSVTCNFPTKCFIKSAQDIKAQTLQNLNSKPVLSSIDKATFFSGGVMTVPLVIHGSGFSSTSNTVLLKPQNSQRVYEIGAFPSKDGATINATSGFTTKAMYCSNGCSEILAQGNYDVVVKTSGGESDAGYISIKGVVTSTTPNSPNASFIPKSTHVKLATFTLSSSVGVALKSFNLKVTASNSTLSGKVSNYTLTDVLADKIINGGPNFTFTDQYLIDNQSKIYELYADIADVDVSYAGQLTYSGGFIIKDYIANNEITVPVKDVVISVSY